MVGWRRKKAVQEPVEIANGAANEEGEESPQSKRKLRDKLNDKNRWYWKFAQQRLPGWAPILTANGVVLYFLCVCVVCTALGVPILLASLSVDEYSVRYDDAGEFADLSRSQATQRLVDAGGAGVPLTVSLPIERTMDPPIYVLFQLDHYYQNHKRYVRSMDADQLGGKPGAATSTCSPEQYVNGSANSALPASGSINPCGLIAWSFFNDTFALSLGGGGQQLPIDESSIAWPYDQDHLYGGSQPVNYNVFPAERGGNTSEVPVNQNQHLMVWLRPAAQPSFRKNWGRIDQRLPAGTVLQVQVQNRYDTYQFGGAKRFIVTTNSWMGGRNMFLGIIYLVVAGLAMLACLAFVLCYHAGLIKRRRFGDLNDLSWQRRQ